FLAPWRLFSIIPSLIYLALLLFVFRPGAKRRGWIFLCHVATLTGWMTTLVGVCVATGLHPAAINGLMFVVLGVFVMSVGGARTGAIPYALTLLPFFGFVFFNVEVDPLQWGDLMNVLYLTLGALAFAELQERLFRRKLRSDSIAAFEKKKSDGLLAMMLPTSVLEEIRTSGSARPTFFSEASILFTDFKGFTGLAEQMRPEELLSELDHCFSEFDRIVVSHGLQRIKTIGDAYMCAGGLPEPLADHASRCVQAALQMRDFVHATFLERQQKGMPYWEVRIGVHTGPVIAGVVGEHNFSYDIWGDAVNTASRMESSGSPGKVNVSAATRVKLGPHFQCSPRGLVEAKGKDPMEMYFVEAA
ncbi:MAG: adenylate/guanylate cyclase domain-containing protein, partial [Leptospiraceae bacterium]|nr:adenylate/guanylate cyclase domain-containing protein [Leptospiraceae bacterium]